MFVFCVKMLVLIVILLFDPVFGQFSQNHKCSTFEFPCTDGRKCIYKRQWCDAVIDCSDESDEMFCTGTIPCVEGQFRCRGGRCIPAAGRCDGFRSCKDNSDEEDCNDTRIGFSPSNNRTVKVSVQPENEKNTTETPDQQTEYASDIKQAVEAAADFLLDKRHADYGWGSAVATSRAIVALAFAERIRQLPTSEWQLMKKQLNIQLSLKLLPSPMKTRLSHLALYINALYATCQDPRSFQGLDLVKNLKAETEGMSPKFSPPIVLLTLCIVNESDPMGDRIQQLRNIYASSDRISTQALALRAWDCMARKLRDPIYFNQYTKHLSEFSSKMVNMTSRNLDVYSTALFFQAYNAAVSKSNMSILMRHRRDDGSFGDLLATYYAIPALLNATLLQLHCSVPVKQKASTENTFNMYSGGKSVTYSLWIPTDAYVNARTVTVNYGDQTSFYEIMRMAGFKDLTYKFMYDEADRRIYSIGDIPNDAETRTSWTLYQAHGEIAVNTLKNLKEITSDVNDIRPEDGAHYIFWLKRN